MRVIAGRFRNRSLKADDHFRPTTDRVRETLFNILQSELEDCVFVDVFAGSGAVGIEALSRGARMAYFVEAHRKALQVLESNLVQCAADTSWRIYSMPVPRALEEIRRHEPAVDLVYFDPPYDFRDYTGLLEGAFSIFPEAMLIVETSRRTQYSVPEGLGLSKERVIGETRVAFFKASPAPSQS